MFRNAWEKSSLPSCWCEVSRNRTVRWNIFLFLFFIIHLSMFPIRKEIFFLKASIGFGERKPVDGVLNKGNKTQKKTIRTYFSFLFLTRFQERRKEPAKKKKNRKTNDHRDRFSQEEENFSPVRSARNRRGEIQMPYHHVLHS